MLTLSVILFIATALGFVLLALQLWGLRRHLRAAHPPAAFEPAVSILKPLCGLDDELEENLESFPRLDYPGYEVLLGVRNRKDAAYPLARAMAARHPRRMRVVIQRGEPGLNPKVNQLITLAAAARHDVLVV